MPNILLAARQRSFPKSRIEITSASGNALKRGTWDAERFASKKVVRVE